MAKVSFSPKSASVATALRQLNDPNRLPADELVSIRIRLSNGENIEDIALAYDLSVSALKGQLDATPSNLDNQLEVIRKHSPKDIAKTAQALGVPAEQTEVMINTATMLNTLEEELSTTAIDTVRSLRRSVAELESRIDDPVAKVQAMQTITHQLCAMRSAFFKSNITVNTGAVSNNSLTLISKA